jgi:CheY-like chemotaxis protein
MFLIIDDSRLARMMAFGLITERYPDAKVVEAVDAETALAAARDAPPKHIFLDHNMPGTAGLDLVDALREAAPTASITLVTANIQSSIRERAEASGCRFIAKPLTAEKVDALLADLGEGT